MGTCSLIKAYNPQVTLKAHKYNSKTVVKENRERRFRMSPEPHPIGQPHIAPK